jgi:ribose transport system substrate-binding protein
MPTNPRKVAVVLHRIKDQKWSERVRCDIEVALEGAALAGTPPIEVTFGDPEGSSIEQIRILESCLRQPVDALIVMPIDPRAVRPILRKFKAAKVPVIVVGNDVGDPDLFDSCVLGHHRQFGREVGAFFVRTMGGEGDLVEIAGLAVSSITSDRSAGFQEVLAPHPRMRVVGACYGDWLYDKAFAEFSRLLDRHERLDGVFAHNDEMAAAALDAASEHHREEQLLVVGIDALPSAIKLVSTGRQAATFLYPSPGKDAVYVLLALLNGEPCLKRVFLHTWPYRSNARIREWQGRRAAGNRPVSPPGAAP